MRTSFSVVLFNLMDAIDWPCFTIRTLQTALTPLTVVAVIAHSPTFTPVTTPSPLTVATLASEVVHVSCGFVVSAGSTDRRIAPCSPGASVIVRLYSSIARGNFSTRTWQAAECPLLLTVMVASPTPTAVTLPLASTRATFSSLERHSTASVASAGVSVAVSAAD